jgi:hypothetical protein
MNEFKSLEAADALIAHITGEPLEVGRALALARDGKVKISFFCNDRLGYFRITGNFPSAAEKTNDVHQYVGFLTSVARPRLNVRSEKWTEEGSEVTLHSSLIVVDVIPDQVKMPHKPGFFIALVRTWVDENSNIRSDNGLDMRPIPRIEWCVASDEIRAVFQKPRATWDVVVKTGGDGQGQRSQERPAAHVVTTVAPAPVGDQGQKEGTANGQSMEDCIKSAQHLKELPPSAAIIAANVGEVWRLTEPQRYQGYTKPLYDLLGAALASGQPCPRARDVIDTWKANRPYDVFEVSDSEIKYYDRRGDIKTANLEAIQATINRMTRR